VASNLRLFFAALPLFSGLVAGQSFQGPDFRLALPNHQGQLKWSAPGFKIIQSSAKSNGREIGIRGQEESGRLSFLGFLFLFPEQAPLTSAKCRDEVLGPEKKSNSTLRIVALSEDTRAASSPIALASYTARASGGSTAYMLRGFVAAGDICGDLELYSKSAIDPEDPAVKKILSSYRLDENYSPGSTDAFAYAQILYVSHQYRAAAPTFETALERLAADTQWSDKTTIRRVLTDQAGMAYGMSGNLAKARTIFLKGIAEDPGYALYYYNLACTDAGENNLSDAKAHLREAFARRANVVRGETLPDPMHDDSFLPYRGNKEFWTFLENLSRAR
jgi:hypothetical protein